MPSLLSEVIPALNDIRDRLRPLARELEKLDRHDLCDVPPELEGDSELAALLVELGEKLFDVGPAVQAVLGRVEVCKCCLDDESGGATDAP